MPLAQIKSQFRAIDSHDKLVQYVTAYQLADVTDEPKTQILGVYKGACSGYQLEVRHRWYDRCKPYVIQEDGNEITLNITDAFGAPVDSVKVKYVQD